MYASLTTGWEKFAMRRDQIEDVEQAVDAESDCPAGESKTRHRRPRGAVRSVGTLGLSVAVTAALGYLLLLIAGSYLSSAENAVFLGFWGFLMGVGSALSPIEQEVSRHTAVALAAARKPDGAALRTFLVTQSIAAVVGLVVLVPSVNDRLFGQHSSLGVVALCGVVAFPTLYGTRGLLIGLGATTRYSAILLVEACLRIVFFALLVVAGIMGLAWLATAVAAGSFAWVFFASKLKGAVDFSTSAESWGSAARRMLGLMFSATLTASVLTGYPAVVKLVAPAGSDDLLGGLFLAVSLFRSPLLLIFAPMQTLAIPTVVRISRRPDGVRRLRKIVVSGGAAALLLGLVAAAGAYVIGPWTFKLLYKDKYHVPDWVMASLGWSGIALAATMLAVAAMIARKKTSHVVLVWSTVAAASLILLVCVPGDIVFRAAIGATVAPTLGLVVAILLLLKQREGDAI